MPRLDLFTIPSCPQCPQAREVVAAFVVGNPSVEFREWDLTQDPGPAVGRGIFMTPSLLVNSHAIVLGVPTEEAIRSAIAAGGETSHGHGRTR